MVRLCRIKAQEFAVFCGGSIRVHPSAIFIHDITGYQLREVPGSLRGGLNLPVNRYFVRSAPSVKRRLRVLISMGVSM